MLAYEYVLIMILSLLWLKYNRSKSRIEKRNGFLFLLFGWWSVKNQILLIQKNRIYFFFEIMNKKKSNFNLSGSHSFCYKDSKNNQRWWISERNLDEIE